MNSATAKEAVIIVMFTAAALSLYCIATGRYWLSAINFLLVAVSFALLRIIQAAETIEKKLKERT